MKFNEEIHRELNKLFGLINNRFYLNALPNANILIQSAGAKRNTLGWITVNQVWKIKDNQYYEIAITAEHLNRPFYEVVGTLMHEMVHLHNLVNEIKDTSGTEYHNKRFRDVAETKGLVITYAKRIGWSVTTLSDEAKDWVDKLTDIDRAVFDAVRQVPVKVKPKAPKTYTYTCPVCNEKILSKNPTLLARCGECDVDFERPML